MFILKPQQVIIHEIFRKYPANHGRIRESFCKYCNSKIEYILFDLCPNCNKIYLHNTYIKESYRICG
jgi:hypothetical protein